MAYATGEELLERFDARLIGDLVKDNGVQEPVASLPEHQNLLSAIDDASADVDAALVVGGRYTPDDLQNNLSASAATFLRRLTCGLALIYLKQRRGRFDPEKDGALLKEINGKLDSLRTGANLLLLGDQEEAPASTIDLVTPKLVPVCRRNTIRARTRNYYPLPRDNSGCGQ